MDKKAWLIIYVGVSLLLYFVMHLVDCIHLWQMDF